MYQKIIINPYDGTSHLVKAKTEYSLENALDKKYEEFEKEHYIKERTSEANAENTRIKNILDNYNSIIKKSIAYNFQLYFEELFIENKYKPFESKLIKPNMFDIMKQMEVPYDKKSAIHFKYNKEKKNKEQESQRVFDLAVDYYNKELEKEKKKYLEEAQQYHIDLRKKIEKEKSKLESKDSKEIEKYFSFVLNHSIYPKDIELTKSFELSYLEDRNTIVVSYNLPKEKIVPIYNNYKFIKKDDTITKSNIKESERESIYNNIIYMITLRTIKEIFDSDEKGFVESVVFNGWLDYIDKRNGKDSRSCIITLETTKEKFNDINLNRVDCKECIKGLKGIFASSFLNITPVMPYLNIDRNDSRFIESKEVKDIGLDGYNLATMPWEDFEYFVRELFDKMFNVNGGEVKVTQASHDGGVDAIAFDDDPIRGGKFVIQAKRYNNVVPVSAVRDLYGTMISEGATKGIIVTTSFYGKESYDFAKDKPITLIDGSALLGLLNKYGYENLTIKLDK